MQDYELELTFDKGYIADPYWPEQEKVINIIKESGAKRARTPENAAKALDAYLSSHSMTRADFEKLEKLAARSFYRNDTIIIPSHHLYGCLANAADVAPAAVRIAKPEQIRSIIEVSDLATSKTEADGVWERFAVVTGGSGSRISNQRGLRSNEYIENFTATGTLHVISDVAEQKLLDFLRFAGREVGIGASRKLGWGRFTVGLKQS